MSITQKSPPPPPFPSHREGFMFEKSSKENFWLDFTFLRDPELDAGPSLEEDPELEASPGLKPDFGFEPGAGIEANSALEASPGLEVDPKLEAVRRNSFNVEYDSETLESDNSSMKSSLFWNIYFTYYFVSWA